MNSHTTSPEDTIDNNACENFTDSSICPVELITTDEELTRIQSELPNFPANTIRDSDSNSNEEGYILVPTKLPLRIFAGLLVQFIALVVGGTFFYSGVTNSLTNLEERTNRLEKSTYTTSEAKLRAEIQSMENDNLKRSIDDLKDKVEGLRK